MPSRRQMGKYPLRQPVILSSAHMHENMRTQRLSQESSACAALRKKKKNLTEKLKKHSAMYVSKFIFNSISKRGHFYVSGNLTAASLVDKKPPKPQTVCCGSTSRVENNGGKHAPRVQERLSLLFLTNFNVLLMQPRNNDNKKIKKTSSDPRENTVKCKLSVRRY